MRIAMDTDALIKLTKAAAKEAVCDAFSVVLSLAVNKESVDQGKAGGFPDALRIEQNLHSGRLSVVRPRRSARVEKVLRELSLSGGEADTLRVYRSGGADVVVSDDGRFLNILDGLGVPFTTPSALIAALVRKRKLPAREGMAYLEALVTMISEAEYLETRRVLEEE